MVSGTESNSFAQYGRWIDEEYRPKGHTKTTTKTICSCCVKMMACCNAEARQMKHVLDKPINCNNAKAVRDFKIDFIQPKQSTFDTIEDLLTKGLITMKK